MKPQTRRFKLFLLLCALVFMSGLTVSYKAALRVAGVSWQERKPVTSKETLPKLVSKVKKLEMAGATIKGEGGPSPTVTIEVKNNSDLAVTYFALTNGSLAADEYGVASNGLNDPDNPRVVIEPHGTSTIDMLLSNLDGRYPIILSAAVFADNSEDGDESVLKQMRAVRARDKARRDQERGATP
jgi:hypothetical protein